MVMYQAKLNQISLLVKQAQLFKITSQPFVDYEEADEAIKMDQLDELLAPMATRIVTDFETDYAKFMMANTALLAGTVGTGVSTWDDVAEAGAIMQATGVPMDQSWCYAVNPFTQRKLASDQRSLGGETGAMTANQRATITDNFAGMKVMTATTLANYSTGVRCRSRWYCCWYSGCYLCCS